MDLKEEIAEKRAIGHIGHKRLRRWVIYQASKNFISPEYQGLFQQRCKAVWYSAVSAGARPSKGVVHMPGHGRPVAEEGQAYGKASAV